jgi:cytochrome c553
MKNVAIMCLLALLQQPPQQPPQPPPGGERLRWAFPTIEGVRPVAPEGPRTVPGSTKTYTAAQIDDLNNPPDWHPDQHPPAPNSIVRGSGQVFACGSCHLMSGVGHPESSDLTGFTAAYLIQQMQDFKSGVRKDAANRMNAIAQGLSDEETRQAAEWFVSLKKKPWNKTVETNTVPKTYVGQGRMRFVNPDGGTEPIGNRIITLPEDQVRAASRDPNSGFVSNVPVGSVAKGKALVEGGAGKTVACSICHGDNLQGLANIPRLAGLHPVYLFRQLYIFKNGDRNGPEAPLMKKAVAQLTEEDMLNIAAYLGSLQP